LKLIFFIKGELERRGADKEGRLKANGGPRNKTQTPLQAGDNSNYGCSNLHDPHEPYFRYETKITTQFSCSAIVHRNTKIGAMKTS
jgi:hypothetical protein